jgi:hypothetical protein
MSDISNNQKLGDFERNPAFQYPKDRDYIRFLDAQKRLDDQDAGGGIRANTFDFNHFAIKRGFIKNLQPATLQNAPLLGQCYFQFNPQEIRQNVQMREDIYNPIALTPEQLSQPIGGNVNFQFDLFFDRSYELATRPGGSGLRIVEELGEDAANDLINIDSNGNRIPKGPDQVGVYADLRVLYNIIGQGLSEGLISLQLEMLRGTYNAKVARENAYAPKTETETGSTASSEAFGDPFSNDFTDTKTLEEFFNANIGNAAFLLPNPVRIVFSPMLMVDGFVTSTNVDFLKFTSEMIPMQCRVAMSINALYIGFNKSTTFLTKTIDNARNVLREENVEDTKNVNIVENALLSLNEFRIALGYGPPTDSWDSAMVLGPSKNQLIQYLGRESPPIVRIDGAGVNLDPTQRVAYAGFPAIRIVKGEGKDKDPILTLFEDTNISFSISYKWVYEIYGWVGQNATGGAGYDLNEATTIAANKSAPSLAALGAQLIGLYSGDESASSPDSWGRGDSGSGSGDDKIRRRKYTGLVNSAPNTLDIGPSTSPTSARRQNVLNSYYIIRVKLELSITAGTITKSFGTSPSGGIIKVLRGDDTTGISQASVTASSGTFYSPQKVTAIKYVSAG